MIVPADGCAEAPGSGRLSRVWPAVAPSVAEARTAVSAFAEAAGATADALAAVSLAVSEAVTNAVLHAYLDHDSPARSRSAPAARPRRSSSRWRTRAAACSRARTAPGSVWACR